MKHRFYFILLFTLTSYYSYCQNGNSEKNYLFECVLGNTNFEPNDFNYLRTIEAKNVNMFVYEYKYFGINVTGPYLTITLDKKNRIIDYSMPPVRVNGILSVSYKNNEVSIRDIVNKRSDAVIYEINKTIYPLEGIWKLGWHVRFYDFNEDKTIKAFIDDENGQIYPLSSNVESNSGKSSVIQKEDPRHEDFSRSIMMCSGAETVPFSFSNPFNDGSNNGNDALPTSLNHNANAPATCWIGNWSVPSTPNGTFTINEAIIYYDADDLSGRVSSIADLTLAANYNKLYPYSILNSFFDLYPDLLPGAHVQCTIAPFGGGSGWDGSRILFNNSDWATDLFSVIHAGIAAHFSGASNSSGLDLGTKDFIAQLHKWDAGFTNHNCYSDPDIIAIVQRVTNFNSTCFATSNSFTTNAQIWSSLLMKIYENHINNISDCIDIADMVFALNSTNQISAAENLFKVIKNGNYVSQSVLCNIRNTIKMHYSCMPDNLEPNLNDADYYIRDASNDEGAEPFSFGQMWTSPSITNVSSAANGVDPVPNEVNTLKITIENRGCSDGPAINDIKLHAYWAMASGGLTWPTSWVDGTYGDELITSPITITSIPAGGTHTASLNWTPPHPDDFPGLGERHHICLYARITDASGGNDKVFKYNGSEFMETSNVGVNTNAANNIAWKNMTLKESGMIVGWGEEDITTIHIENPNPVGGPQPPTNPDGTDPTDIICVINFPPRDPVNPTVGIIDMNNPFNDPNLDFQTGSEECIPIRPIRPYLSDPEFFRKGEVWLNFKHESEDAWGNYKFEGKGFKEGENGWIKIESEDFRINGLNLRRGEHYVLGMKYRPSPAFKPSSFALVQVLPNDQLIGGETYVITQENKQIGQDRGLDIQTQSRNKNIQNVIIKPNPFDDKIDVELTGSLMIDLIEVYDVSGKMVSSYLDIRKNYFSMNTQTWQKGVYTVKITDTSGHKMVKKVVKQ